MTLRVRGLARLFFIFCFIIARNIRSPDSCQSPLSNSPVIILPFITLNIIIYYYLETKMQIRDAFCLLPRNTCVRVRRTTDLKLEVLFTIRYGIDREKRVPLVLGKHCKEKPARTIHTPHTFLNLFGRAFQSTFKPIRYIGVARAILTSNSYSSIVSHGYISLLDSNGRHLSNGRASTPL